MSVPVTTKKRRFTVFLGVEDKKHAGRPLCDYLHKKLIEKHGRENISIEVRPLLGSCYAKMMEKAASAAGKPGHQVKLVLMDADRFQDGVEKKSPESFSTKEFKVLSFDPCSECVVLRLKEPVEPGTRCRACTERLGACDSLDAFKAMFAGEPPSLDELAKHEPLGTAIRLIEEALAKHRV